MRGLQSLRPGAGSVTQLFHPDLPGLGSILTGHSLPLLFLVNEDRACMGACASVRPFVPDLYAPFSPPTSCAQQAS